MPEERAALHAIRAHLEAAAGRPVSQVVDTLLARRPS
jgi:hypothetical protein